MAEPTKRPWGPEDFRTTPVQDYMNKPSLVGKFLSHALAYLLGMLTVLLLEEWFW